ncbi:MAG TPA: CoA ester lyase [Steroidobacteraceae bacterium]|jgi:citrate lyase subunit beta/citryl-CoA lyase|nr:CoA ester lyase [Steroidobacteraceae bacterium]
MKLRSLLFVPGDRPDRVQRAAACGADALILDLEDAVAIEVKAEGRAYVVASLCQRPRPVPYFVRVNALSSRFLDEDLKALAACPPDGIVLPKAEGAASINELVRRMQTLGLSCPILPIATETAAAIFRLGEYATVASQLLGLTWGAEDLPAAIGAESARDADGGFTAPYEMVRSLALFAAHAASVPAIETVFPAFRDLEGLAIYAQRAARDGFTGMLAIHPNQIPAIHAAFTPSPALIERSRRIVAAFANQPGAGVLQVDGAMVDAPHLKLAQRVLSRVADEDCP